MDGKGQLRSKPQSFATEGYEGSREGRRLIDFWEPSPQKGRSRSIQAICFDFLSTTSSQGVSWYHWKGFEFSVPFTEMKLRPRSYWAPTWGH